MPSVVEIRPHEIGTIGNVMYEFTGVKESLQF